MVLVIDAHISYAQQIKVYETHTELDAILKHPDTTYVINYWATWCGPCVKELPYFYDLAHKVKGSTTKVVLVSLDFKSQLEKKLIPFFHKNPTVATVFLLADKDYDSWISTVSHTWDGAIPVTHVRKGDRTIFTEQEFESVSQLQNFIQTLSQ
jgi:thiol-disulfide isomerase/thioredoxin